MFIYIIILYKTAINHGAVERQPYTVLFMTETINRSSSCRLIFCHLTDWLIRRTTQVQTDWINLAKEGKVF